MGGSLYDLIREIVEELRRGSRDFLDMKRRLIKLGLTGEDADKLLDRLLHQVEDE